MARMQNLEGLGVENTRMKKAESLTLTDVCLKLCIGENEIK